MNLILKISFGSAIGCVWPKLNSVTLGRKSVARKKKIVSGKTRLLCPVEFENFDKKYLGRPNAEVFLQEDCNLI